MHSLLTAETSPASAEQDDAFNEWYEQTHIPELRAAIPAITTVSRYRIWQGDDAEIARYIATYVVPGVSAQELASLFKSVAGELTPGPVNVSGKYAGRLTFSDHVSTTD